MGGLRRRKCRCCARRYAKGHTEHRIQHKAISSKIGLVGFHCTAVADCK